MDAVIMLSYQCDSQVSVEKHFQCSKEGLVLLHTTVKSYLECCMYAQPLITDKHDLKLQQIQTKLDGFFFLIQKYPETNSSMRNKNLGLQCDRTVFFSYHRQHVPFPQLN